MAVIYLQIFNLHNHYSKQHNILGLHYWCQDNYVIILVLKLKSIAGNSIQYYLKIIKNQLKFTLAMLLTIWWSLKKKKNDYRIMDKRRNVSDRDLLEISIKNRFWVQKSKHPIFLKLIKILLIWDRCFITLNSKKYMKRVSNYILKVFGLKLSSTSK
jgi:hypothetical protein